MFQGFQIDDSIERVGSGRPYAQEGEYLFRVSSVAPSDEKHDGDAYWRWMLQIVAGPDAVGRTFPHTGTWKTDRQWGNGRILSLIDPALIGKLKGKGVTTYASFVAITKKISDAVAGKRVGGMIQDGEPYKGRPQSEITEFYPESEYSQRSQLVATAPAAPKSPKAPAPATEQSLEAQVEDLFKDDEDVTI